MIWSSLTSQDKSKKPTTLFSISLLFILLATIRKANNASQPKLYFKWHGEKNAKFNIMPLFIKINRRQTLSIRSNFHSYIFVKYDRDHNFIRFPYTLNNHKNDRFFIFLIFLPVLKPQICVDFRIERLHSNQICVSERTFHFKYCKSTTTTEISSRTKKLKKSIASWAV